MNFTTFFSLSKMTRKEFAKKIGVHPATLNRYEKNIVQPSASVAKKIIEESNKMITLDDIVEPWEKKHGI